MLDCDSTYNTVEAARLAAEAIRYRADMDHASVKYKTDGDYASTVRKSAMEATVALYKANIENKVEQDKVDNEAFAKRQESVLASKKLDKEIFASNLRACLYSFAAIISVSAFSFSVWSIPYSLARVTNPIGAAYTNIRQEAGAFLGTQLPIAWLSMRSAIYDRGFPAAVLVALLLKIPRRFWAFIPLASYLGYQAWRGAMYVIMPIRPPQQDLARPHGPPPIPPPPPPAIPPGPPPMAPPPASDVNPAVASHPLMSSHIDHNEDVEET